jgi:hypothetical protein
VRRLRSSDSTKPLNNVLLWWKSQDGTPDSAHLPWPGLALQVEPRTSTAQNVNHLRVFLESLARTTHTNRTPFSGPINELTRGAVLVDE